MTQVAISNRTAVQLFNGTASIVLSEKTGKAGSLAAAVAFAGRNEKMMLSQSLYFTWLTNGQFRPIINDVVNVSGIIPKAAIPYAIPTDMPISGPVNREKFVDFCKRVVSVVDGSGKEVKGKKLFYLELLRRCIPVTGTVGS